ncbi:hydroxymethylglutaryl-CoA synthase [Pseudozyma hubeiensis SY62]|uniref:Hydroxymethylglutaryl-CoA synthase n=1 Tax=Pseudozyma hubeiensis (strain SY62) TaxID=1305764 RepID=R9PC74_PSEHS|nr:hydroxymethylglutaryl-CoA synthase [Pseudozyma hubeiensis SY62]GAC95680.1 hydroxymethylglutaryl-CoA synthase [Pseudozyma hubeiensis SY62]
MVDNIAFDLCVQILLQEAGASYSQISDTPPHKILQPCSFMTCIQAKTESLRSLWRTLLEHSGGAWPPSPDFDLNEPVLIQLAKLAVEASSLVSRKDVEGLGEIDIQRNRTFIDRHLPHANDVLHALRGLNQRKFLGAASCIAFLSHLYRWGIVPVIAVAQEDIASELPSTLQTSFAYVNSRLGLKTSGGTMTTMTYCNYRSDLLALTFSTTASLGSPYTLAETWNARLFVELEHLASPFYRSVLLFAEEIDQGKDSEALKEGVDSIRAAFKFFYRNLQESVVPKAVWMSHAQGFHGWGWGGDEGVSGDQAMIIRTLDALLSIPPSSDPTHLSGPQRNFLQHLRSQNLRQRTAALPHASKSLGELLQALKMWRLGHIKKALYYEDLNLPERKPMTAGSGVEVGAGLQDLLTKLDTNMRKRIALTK